MMSKEYFKANREAWDAKTQVHVKSELYDVESFKKGRTTLREADLAEIGSLLKGRSVLHLQCHFGLDSLSIEREGASVTAVDFSREAIDTAEKLKEELNLKTRFICCNVYDLPQYLDEQFDIVFTTYGTIGWLPDLESWSKLVHRYLKPGGILYLAEFHPFLWTMTDDFQSFGHYPYFFEKKPFVEDEEGTYTDRSAPLKTRTYSWNHHFGEVLGTLLERGLNLKSFNEYPYSPWDCFPDLEEIGYQRWVFKKWKNKIPYFYTILMKKEGEHLENKRD